MSYEGEGGEGGREKCRLLLYASDSHVTVAGAR